MSLKMTYFLQSSALVSPHFFSQHQAAFLGHRWRNSRGCAIYVGIPSLILAKWRKLFWASKGRDALKPNFNKWPEEPFLPSRNGSSGHLLKFGFKVSRPLLAKWRKLRHLCPKKGQLWCLSWWFCLLPGDNSDRCGIFWLGWLMDVGRYEGVAPSMWAFPAWFWRTSWSCAIYAQKGSLMLRKKMGGNQRSANFPLGFAPENGPHQVSSFLWQTQEKKLNPSKKKFRVFEWGLRDIDGATQFQGIAMQL